MKGILVHESPFFANLLSDDDNMIRTDESGTMGYFVDSDPQLFEYILRYLRRGVMPLCWSRSSGHDYSLYASLLAEAKFFGIDRLKEYLINQQWDDVIEIHRTETTSKDLALSSKSSFSTSGDEKYWYYPSWSMNKGTQNSNASGSGKKDSLQMLKVHEEIVFDPEKLISAEPPVVAGRRMPRSR
jgi:hypothetical protein